MIEDTPYKGLFSGLRQRIRHYRAVFGAHTPSSAAVMADLLKFSRFFATTKEPGQSTEEMLILEGRRQVILRILQHTRLSAEELFTYLQGLDEPTRIALFDNNRPAIPVYEDR